MEPDIPIGRHRGVARLERPPFAGDDPHKGAVEGGAE
jgi:hypothetical protein